jgi:hypothetical protein
MDAVGTEYYCNGNIIANFVVIIGMLLTILLVLFDLEDEDTTSPKLW